MSRKGSAIMMAIVVAMILFIAISALLNYSSGEMKHTRAISAVKKAELLSMSGIDWAESELRNGRWYGTDFVPYEMNKGKHATYGVKKLTPFGSGEGKVTVVCEDVANKNPGYNMFGMQKIWFLHHINVYALGEFDNQKCLMYGRYIISPEPALNSKSTEAAQFVSPETGIVGGIPVIVPPETINGKEVNEFIVKEIKVSKYDKVDQNSVVAVLNPVNDTEHEIYAHPDTFGEVTQINKNKNEYYRAGDNLMVLTKRLEVNGTDINRRTLKKMVRVTKIPLEIWKGLDIEDRNDRFALSQYISGLSDAYLQNFVAHSSLDEAVKSIGDKKFDTKISASEVLSNFPAHITSTTRNRAENTFIAHMIKNFTAPGGTWENKEKALNSTILKLDHEPVDERNAPQEFKDFVAWLKELGRDVYELSETAPKKEPKLYKPRMKNDEFLTLLKPHMNQPSSEFIRELSSLKDASRIIEVEEIPDDEVIENMNGKETEDTIEKYIERDGQRIRIFVTKIEKPYTFVDPESGFAIEMEDLLTFIKKYYDDECAVSPREEVRKNEHVDWPLPKPEDPATKPADQEGGHWVWVPGTPGTPPGDPTYDHNGGSDRQIDPPTAGMGGYEPDTFGGPDGGRKDWKIDGIPGSEAEDGDGDKNRKENEDLGSVKVCNCNGGNCNKCNPKDPEKIVMSSGTEWKVKEGTPGKEPSQGCYVWQEDNTATNDGEGGTPGTPGSGSGTSNSNDDASDAPSGDGGTSGSGSTGTPSDPAPYTPPAPYQPPRSYRSGSGAF